MQFHFCPQSSEQSMSDNTCKLILLKHTTFKWGQPCPCANRLWKPRWPYSCRAIFPAKLSSAVVSTCIKLIDIMEHLSESVLSTDLYQLKTPFLLAFSPTKLLALFLTTSLCLLSFDVCLLVILCIILLTLPSSPRWTWTSIRIFIHVGNNTINIAQLSGRQCVTFHRHESQVNKIGHVDNIFSVYSIRIVQYLLF